MSEHERRGRFFFYGELIGQRLKGKITRSADILAVLRGDAIVSKLLENVTDLKVELLEDPSCLKLEGVSKDFEPWDGQGEPPTYQIHRYQERMERTTFYTQLVGLSFAKKGEADKTYSAWVAWDETVAGD